jgi:hypothetical protein
MIYPTWLKGIGLYPDWLRTAEEPLKKFYYLSMSMDRLLPTQQQLLRRKRIEEEEFLLLMSAII